MRSIATKLILFTLLLAGISASTPSIDFRTGRHNNVCKELKNDILIYFVFIDTRSTAPWSEFDILTTIDSIQVASRWLVKQADAHDIPLKIKTDYYIGDDFSTIERNLPGKTVNEVIEKKNLIDGIKSLSRWGDYIAKIIGESVYITEKDGIPIQKAPANKERLIAFLRDEYQVESVAMLLLVNNYFRSDISLAVNSLHDDDVEFSVVSYKYPSEIVHNLLHLYGAADLHETHFRRSRKNLKLAGRDFPDDIMTDVYARSLETLEIGGYTQYMIGWKDDMKNQYEPLMTERFTLFK
ncbi:MAG: hypothetical protein ABFS10_06400 [Bacteroidota bacterium]